MTLAEAAVEKLLPMRRLAKWTLRRPLNHPFADWWGRARARGRQGSQEPHEDQVPYLRKCAAIGADDLRQRPLKNQHQDA